MPSHMPDMSEREGDKADLRRVLKQRARDESVQYSGLSLLRDARAAPNYAPGTSSYHLGSDRQARFAPPVTWCLRYNSIITATFQFLTAMVAYSNFCAQHQANNPVPYA